MIDGKDDEMLIGGVLCLIVGVLAKGISLVLFTWLVAELKIVLLKLYLLIHSMGSYFVGFSPIYEVLVIGLDDNRLIRRSGMK